MVSRSLYKALNKKNVYYVVYNKAGIIAKGTEYDGRKTTKTVEKELLENHPGAKVLTLKTSVSLTVSHIDRLVQRAEADIKTMD